jgi:methylisocitrate lyase
MRSDLPLIVDIGVGFGDAIHLSRAVWELEQAGASGLELEDQVSPKRASHHRNIEHLVPTEVMTAKIRFAAQARRDPGLVLIARTGALQNEGPESAVTRCEAYLQAGADVVMVLPRNDQELREMPQRISGPVGLLTSFDLQPGGWHGLGYSLVIDGLTGEAVSFQAIREAYTRQQQGLPSGLPPKVAMHIFEELHELSGTEELYQIERETTEPGT